MPEGSCHIGLIGLGVMGRNLVLNMADHGFAVAVYNRSSEKTRQFLEQEAGARDIRPGYSLEEFVRRLRRPRAMIILVAAGAPVDEVLAELGPYLEPGDVILDGGNSHYRDTDRRSRALAADDLLFLGLGVSGGESGARYGPSLMPGGPEAGYARVAPILEAAAARVEGEPCVAYLGPGAAGHYVKMVHNGIEYGVQQLLAETYDLLKLGAGLDNDGLSQVFAGWNQGRLQSFLVEITGKIFLQDDDRTGQRLVDLILDVARQKGTGTWTSQEGRELGTPVPNIDVAVTMRHFSELKAERLAASRLLAGPPVMPPADRQALIDQVGQALYGAALVVYAQGLALLHRGSDMHGYGLNLATVARIWRGGCIIRAAFLEDIRRAYANRPDLANILLDERLGPEIAGVQAQWRAVVQQAVAWGLPVPGLSAGLAYFDAYRRARLPANLIQAQRDFFGSHTYERLDLPGTFHTDWLDSL